MVWASSEKSRLQGPTSHPPHCWTSHACLCSYLRSTSSWFGKEGPQWLCWPQLAAVLWLDPSSHPQTQARRVLLPQQGTMADLHVYLISSTAWILVHRMSQTDWGRCIYIYVYTHTHRDIYFGSYPRLEEAGGWSIARLVGIITFHIQSQGKRARKRWHVIMGTAAGYHRPPFQTTAGPWGRGATEMIKTGAAKRGVKLLQNEGLNQVP